MTALLLGGAGVDQHRAHDVDGDGVEDLGRAGTRHLLGEDDLLLQRRAAPAVLARPLDADPAAAGELALPGALEDPSLVLVVGRRGAREMRREPRAQLRAEGLLLGRVAESEHPFVGPIPSATPAANSAPRMRNRRPAFAGRRPLGGREETGPGATRSRRSLDVRGRWRRGIGRAPSLRPRTPAGSGARGCRCSASARVAYGSPGTGPNPGGGTRGPRACSYAEAIASRTGSDQGRPRNWTLNGSVTSRRTDGRVDREFHRRPARRAIVDHLREAGRDADVGQARSHR